MNSAISSFIFCGQAAVSTTAAVGALFQAGPVASTPSLALVREAFVSRGAHILEPQVGAFVTAVDEFTSALNPDDPRDASVIFRERVAKGIEQMGDGNWSRMFLTLFSRRPAPWENKDPAKFTEETGWEDDIDFPLFVRHLSTLINKGLFTADHYREVMARFEEDNVITRKAVLKFLSNNLELLIERGLFTAKDCRTITKKLGHFGEDTRRGVLEFFGKHLPLLIGRGLFTAEQCEMIIANLKNDERGVPADNRQFFHKHLPLLLERGLVGVSQAAILVSSSPGLFQRHFHVLSHYGLIGRPLIEELLSRADLADEVVSALVSVLSGSPEWMASPTRWLQLLNVLGNKTAKIALAKVVSAELEGHGNTAGIADIGALISFLSGADPDETQTAADFTDLIGDTAMEMKAVLIATAQRLGLETNPYYLAVLQMIDRPGSERLLADWALEGMDKIWGGYRLIGEKEADNKKTRNRFKNFLESASKREFPPISRLAVKRGLQAVEDGFVKRLKKGADESDEKRIDTLRDSGAWNTLKSRPLYQLLIKASRFMQPAGTASMRRLILGLRMEKGKLIYPRYGELAGVVGDEFLKNWRGEYSVEPEDLGNLDAEAGQKVMKAQVLSQVDDHMAVREGFDEAKTPEAIRNLPERVKRWKEGFEASAELDSGYLTGAEELLSVFEAHYNEIRAHLGDTFANIRTDLKNYMAGMVKGVRTAKKGERFEVTGDIEMIARSGSDPVTTCQNLEFAWVNQEGQPIHRMIHGQIKIANWLIDGAITARHMLEPTVDGEGREHLLVDRLYASGGFGRMAEIKAQILKYAERLGITQDRVHFTGDASELTAPKPIKTGDNIYRDTFREEGWSFDEIREMRERGFSSQEEAATATARPSLASPAGQAPARWQTTSP